MIWNELKKSIQIEPEHEYFDSFKIRKPNTLIRPVKTKGII
jgi:hypothetical protein